MWRLSLAFVAGFACQGALAQVQGMQAGVSARPAPVEQPAVLELATSNLPRFDVVEPGAAGGQRIDLTVLPPRRSALGLAVGMTGFAPQPAAAGAFQGTTPPPAVDVGLHWRHTLDNDHRIDITAWRRMSQGTDGLPLALQRGPTYGARVEFNLSPRSSRKTDFKDRGFIGMQLENGGRLSIRRKHGGPMVYYRNTF